MAILKAEAQIVQKDCHICGAPLTAQVWDGRPVLVCLPCRVIQPLPRSGGTTGKEPA